MAPPTTMEELPQLTASDMNFLKAAFVCFTQPPQMDREKMAQLLGVKARSIDHRWWAIRKKLGQLGEATPNAPATPNAGRKTSSLNPKKRGPAPDDDDEDDEEIATPKRGKKAGTTGPKRGAAKKDGDAPKTKAKAKEEED